MSQRFYRVSSVTYAVKGRDALIRNGYRAEVVKNPHPSRGDGCGYLLRVENADVRCLDILRRNGVRAFAATEGERRR